MNITIMVYSAGSDDAKIPVFGVTLEHNEGVWDESFGTLGELNAYLNGIRSTLAYFGPVEERMKMIPRFHAGLNVNVMNAPYQLWPGKT